MWVFVIGLIIGLVFYFFKWKITTTKSDILVVPTINAHQYFNELEICVFQKILASKDKSISSHDLNLLIGQENLSTTELNRLRRNLLKDLNLKIQTVFGISNGIWQVDSIQDKKVKNYMVSKKFKLTELKKIFLGGKPGV
jgi:hypothetical protein